jgi:hypothetical protein
MMPRRKNWVPTLLIVIAVVIVVAWLYRTQLFSSPASKAPRVADPPETRIGPADIYPDPVRTPGEINQEIAQDNIGDTICSRHWSTQSIRPPAGYTTRLKVEQIREYGYADHSLRDYEEDHFIPLELGGHPTDPKNLWPEPFDTSIPDGGAHFKDKVENYLHAQVCSGSMTLEEAQKEIASDWYRVYEMSVPH